MHLGQRRQDVLVRGPNPVVDLDELPAHDTLLVDDERGGMRDRHAAIGVENPIPVDDGVVRVGQYLVLDEHAIVRSDPVDHHLLFLTFVYGHGKEFGVLPLLRRQEVSQLPELTGAVGSPVPSIELEDNGLVTAEVREGGHGARVAH